MSRTHNVGWILFVFRGTARSALTPDNYEVLMDDHLWVQVKSLRYLKLIRIQPFIACYILNVTGMSFSDYFHCSYRNGSLRTYFVGELPTRDRFENRMSKIVRPRLTVAFPEKPTF